jgi:hypothetical protein
MEEKLTSPPTIVALALISGAMSSPSPIAVSNYPVEMIGAQRVKVLGCPI